MADTIRIRDLRHPEHADAAKAAFAAIEQLPFDFSTKGIIEAARAESDVPLFEDEEIGRAHV